MKKRHAAFGLAFACVLVGCGTVREDGSPVSVQVLTVGYAPPMSAPGSLEVATSVDVPFGGPGVGTVKKVAAKVGDRVKAGQVLAVLECNQIVGGLTSEVSIPVPRLPMVTSGPNPVPLGIRPNPASDDLKAKMAKDEQAAADAKAKLEALTAQFQPDALAEAQAEQATDQAAFVAADEEAKKKRSYYEQGLIARRDAEHAEAQSADAQAALDAINAKIADLEKMPKAEDVAAANHALTASLNRLARDQADLAANQKSPPVTRLLTMRPSRETELRMPRQSVEAKEVSLRAPISGVITTCGALVGALVAPPAPPPISAPALGPQAFSPQQPLFQISPDARLIFTAVVSQQLFQEIRPGQMVNVILPNLGPTPVMAKILGMEPVVAAPMASGGAPGPLGLSFSVKAVLVSPGGAMTPGMNGQLVLDADAKQIRIPMAAVKTMGGGHGRVMVVEDGRANVRLISYRLAPDGEADVLAGLHPGDRLILSSSGPLAEGRLVAEAAG